MSMNFSTTYDVVEAHGYVFNVPEKIVCKQCHRKAYRNSDVELSENRKPFENFKGQIEYEENYKVEYVCESGHSITAIVNLRE